MEPPPSKKRKRVLSRPPSLTPPTSVDRDDLPQCSEEEVLEQLLRLHTQVNDHTQPANLTDTEAEYISFELSQFTIYQRSQAFAPEDSNDEGIDPATELDEVVPLHLLNTKRGCKELLLDGTVTHAGASFHLLAVTFDILSIEGYGVDCHSVASTIWIQTSFGRKKDVWYRLATPSPQYFRFHSAFLWIADLGKHFIDFLEANSDIHLSDFHNNFHKWITQEHGQSAEFREWFQQFGKVDFRTTIAAHIEYLWNEAGNVIQSRSKLRHHHIWAEAWSNAPSYTYGSISRQDNIYAKRTFINTTTAKAGRQKTSTHHYTVVTPFVYYCFKDMYFGATMEQRHIKSLVVQTTHVLRLQKLGFMTDLEDAYMSKITPTIDPPSDIRAGDVVGVPRDTKQKREKWKDTASIWFVYIKRVIEDKNGKYLEVMWMYSSEQTTCAKMKYPYSNELFASNHCNCGDSNFRLEDVTGKIDVKWSPQSLPGSSYFVRQTYCGEDSSFRTFNPRDLTCSCHQPEPSALDLAKKEYKPGSTVLVSRDPNSHQRLEPVVLVDFGFELVHCRQLLRVAEHLPDHGSAPNELIWTEKIIELRPNFIVRKCNIRFLQFAEKVPAIYDRQGQADCFFIRRKLVSNYGSETVEHLQLPFPGPMDLGFDPVTKPTQTPLATLSLFSGGGNFDRGLEEGGVVDTKWAVEWVLEAVLTYQANCKKGTAIFYGDVNEHLAQALEGKFSRRVPELGEVQVLVAGSPCPGLSNLQVDKLSMASKINTSKVASVASYVDFFRPGYVILENVVAMASGIGKDKQENVFSQLLCTLVGMGYQVQQYLVDPWSNGGAQSRPRLFIAATAPTLQPMRHPNHTHSRPPDTKNAKLGKTVNGQTFGERQLVAASFKYTSCAEATKDLPDIGDGQVSVCIPFPDHRQPISTKPLFREIIRSIPTSPSGMTLGETKKVKKLSPSILKYILKQPALRQQEGSSCWKRASAQHIFPAVVTSLKPDDAKSGACIHWQQDRVFTIMEARRAQGFLDDEPIIGMPTKQYKIVGNSVARSVSLALGMSLREAWLSNPPNIVKKFITPPNVELLTKTELLSREEVRSESGMGITRSTMKRKG